ncbi:MAG: hypothetical protein IH851_06700 [Armatimonadetes bacterium]|nr:hypothetical protein [Armatimonadota bacterium]
MKRNVGRWGVLLVVGLAILGLAIAWFFSQGPKPLKDGEVRDAREEGQVSE